MALVLAPHFNSWELLNVASTGKGPPLPRRSGLEGMESRQCNVKMFLGFSNAHSQPTATAEGSRNLAEAQIHHLLFPQKELPGKQLHPFANQTPVNGHSQVTAVGLSPCRRPCDPKDGNSKSLAPSRVKAQLFLKTVTTFQLDCFQHFYGIYL